MQLTPTIHLPATRVRTLKPLTAFMAAALLCVLAGCATDTSFDRHNLSRVWLSPDGQQLYFDATVSRAYPEDDPEAEQARRSWLADWLKLRKFCTEGHRVASRRAIRADEYNPMRHHLRYEITCASAQ